jgi:hypothetical protein
MKKLTLSADPEVIAEARRLARESGTSVSSMFARFVRGLAKRRGGRRPLGPSARKARGMIRLPRGAACLVSRNPDHFPRSVLPVQTPAEFLAAHFSERS